MPDKKDYPEWFKRSSRLTKPRAPKEPQEEIIKQRDECVACGDGDVILNEKLHDLADAGFDLRLSVDYGWDDINKVSVDAVLEERIPNKGYLSEMVKYEQKQAEYEQKLDVYNAKMVEWKQLAERWDEEKRGEADKKDRELYEQLKKKFEK